MVKTKATRDVTGFFQNNNLSEEEAQILLVDMLMFAGVIGATHLANVVLERLNQGMTPDNIRNFCIESARLDPSVSSFNTISTFPRKVRILGTEVTLPQNLKEMWSLSEANTDPSIFNNPDKFDEYRNLDNVLSWNGDGARACLGKHVSLRIVEKMTQIACDRINNYGMINTPQPKSYFSGLKSFLYKWLYFPVVRQLVKRDNATWSNYQLKKPQPVDLTNNLGKVFSDLKYLELKKMPQEGIELARSSSSSFGINLLSNILDKIVSMVQPQNSFKSDKQARDLFGSKPELPIDDINSESGLLWYFLDSQGAILLEPMGEFVCAQSKLTHDLPVRPNCRPINYKIVIDPKQRKVIEIKLQGQQVSIDACACQEVLSHAWMQITLENHFFNQHKLCAGGFAIALQQYLSPDHPIRRLLHRCCVGPLDILSKAYKILFLEDNGSIYAL